MSSAAIAEAKKKGAEVVAKPRLMEGTFDAPGLVEAMTKLAEAQRQESASQNKALLKSIDSLAAAIASREFPSTDMSEVAAAVAGLHQEATANHAPLDYRLDFERDQRGFMKTGVQFIAVPRKLDS